MHLTKTEEALLCNFEEDIDLTGEQQYIKDIWNNDWENLLQKCMEKLTTKANAINLEEIIEKATNGCEDEEIFCMGLACFLLFIQANFTGPPLPSNITTILKNHQLTDIDKVLTVDSEEVNSNALHLELFVIAKYIFKYCKLRNNYVSEWWCLRSVMIHQILLDDITPTLFSLAESHISNLTEWAICNDRLKAKLQTEISQVYLMYYRVIDSETKLKTTGELLGIKINLFGELGKRTKYQERDLAQMKLQVQLSDEITRPSIKNYSCPEIIKLDDDVRLDKIKYTTNQSNILLPATEQAFILANLHCMQRSRPRDELLIEESEAFCSYLLQQNNPWPVRVATLLLRCRLESSHKRTIERSLMQIESIVENLNKEDPNTLQRLTTFWSTCLPSKWQIEAQMADIMLNLGLVKACLDIYLKLQLWEEVIVCYTILNLRHKAAEVIKDQLAIKETVKLWCLLGDATDDVSCYEKAWELSNHRSSRAQRHWGQYLFARKQYADCIPHLEQSLEINSLQSMVLLRLGYAALNVEDWKLAASTYRKYTCLEPNSFEAWNNLAKAYVKLGEKTRAHYALQEALKYSFDNWRVWDNFMVVSADTKNLDDLIRAYHQILNIKEKHLDVEVLNILVLEILTDENYGKLKSKTLELFGRLTSIYPGESRLWEMYADLSPSPDLKAQRLYRAYRGMVQDDWSRDPVKCGKVLEICHRLGEVALTADAASLSSARLTLRAAVAAAKKHSWEQNTEILNSVENVLEKIMNLTVKS